MLTEYNVRIVYDSINNPIRDTISVVKRNYNDRNQIVERNEDFTFSDETMNITYEYNRCNRLEKERVKMSFDSSVVDVDYIYKGSLLKQTISESSRDSITFEQIGLYKYNTDKKLIENSTAQLFIDLKTGDTIKNSLQIDKYNQNEVVIESEIKYQEKPTKNGRTEYFYKAEDLIKTLEYNQNDSLITTYRFEYKKDQIGNWIERKTFKNDKLNSIKMWNIVYR